MNFKMIGISELEKYMDMKNIRIIDLRSQKEYKEYHLQNAINIPLEELQNHINKLSRNKYYILYCQRGGSSLIAAKKMAQLGYHVYSLMGGIQGIHKNIDNKRVK